MPGRTARGDGTGTQWHSRRRRGPSCGHDSRGAFGSDGADAAAPGAACLRQRWFQQPRGRVQAPSVTAPCRDPSVHGVFCQAQK